MDIKTATDTQATGTIDAGAAVAHGATIRHTWHVEHWRDGVLLWEGEHKNLVTTAGLNKYLDATLKTGLAAPAWYVGLVTGPGSGTTYAAGDTMASHAGWAEDVTYSNGARPAFTPGSISGGSVSNTASKAVFNINGTATIAGAFLSDVDTKGDNTGTLFGEGDFTGGDRLVQSGDTLNITITATITAA